jgi:hypothetical protein
MESTDNEKPVNDVFSSQKICLGVQFVCWSFASKRENDIKYNK